LFQNGLTRPALQWLWESGTPFYDAQGRPDPQKIEGFACSDAGEIRKHVKIPVLITGGFQTAHGIAEALRSNACDAVTIARVCSPTQTCQELSRTDGTGRWIHPVLIATVAWATFSKALWDVMTNRESRIAGGARPCYGKFLLGRADQDFA
jgi:hypothetical protein